MEAAFSVAVTAASKDQTNPFEAKIIRTSPGDLLEAEQAMCKLLEVMIVYFSSVIIC